jgi:hypothetical protein
MARKPKQPAQSPVTNPTSPKGRYATSDTSEWGGFININLNEDVRRSFDVWYSENLNQYMRDLDDLMSDGMKISSSYDIANECYIVTLTGRPTPDLDMRCVLTSRAGTWGEAMALAAFKHCVFCQFTWVDYLPNVKNKKYNWG